MVFSLRSCRGVRTCIPSVTFDNVASTSSRIKISNHEPAVLATLMRYRKLFLPRLSQKDQSGENSEFTMDEEWPGFSLSLSMIQPFLNKNETESLVQEERSPSRQSDLENFVTTGLSEKEIERRRKLSAAKKGRKLGEELKQLIRRRTKEAL